MSDPSWMSERPWRDSNPGDLRPLPPALGTWYGQTGIDHSSTAGDYVIFVTRADGWRALAMNLLAYQDHHGINTLAGIAERWAPSADNNNTEAYIRALCAFTGYGRDQVLDLHIVTVLASVALAVSKQEAGSAVQWPADERTSGVMMAIYGGTQPTHAQPGPAPAPQQTADELNAAELQQLGTTA